VKKPRIKSAGAARGTAHTKEWKTPYTHSELYEKEKAAKPNPTSKARSYNAVHVKSKELTTNPDKHKRAVVVEQTEEAYWRKMSRARN